MFYFTFLIVEPVFNVITNMNICKYYYTPDPLDHESKNYPLNVINSEFMLQVECVLILIFVMFLPLIETNWYPVIVFYFYNAELRSFSESTDLLMLI